MLWKYERKAWESNVQARMDEFNKAAQALGSNQTGDLEIDTQTSNCVPMTDQSVPSS